jgi:hypothetical protein
VYCLCIALLSVGREEADPSVAAYWKQLPSATLTHNDTVLELHNGTFFFGSEDLGAKLFIRDFWYDAVENRLKEHFSSGGKAMAIIGNPGDVRQHQLRVVVASEANILVTVAIMCRYW